jgi:dihydroorotase-like cyclic amidohydrolase
MIPICIVLAASLASIMRHVKVDKLYALLIFVAVSGSMGLGWALNLMADLVVFGLLPISVVSALMAIRLAQNLGAARLHELDEHKLTEK